MKHSLGNVVVVNVVVRGRHGRPSWSRHCCLAPTSLKERWGQGARGCGGSWSWSWAAGRATWGVVVSGGILIEIYVARNGDWNGNIAGITFPELAGTESGAINNNNNNK